MSRALLLLGTLMVLGPMNLVAQEQEVSIRGFRICHERVSEIPGIGLISSCDANSVTGPLYNKLRLFFRNHTIRPITALRFVIHFTDPFGDEIWSGQLVFGRGEIPSGPPGPAFGTFFDIPPRVGRILDQYDEEDVLVTLTDVQVVH